MCMCKLLMHFKFDKKILWYKKQIYGQCLVLMFNLSWLIISFMKSCDSTYLLIYKLLSKVFRVWGWPFRKKYFKWYCMCLVKSYLVIVLAGRYVHMAPAIVTRANVSRQRCWITSQPTTHTLSDTTQPTKPS